MHEFHKMAGCWHIKVIHPQFPRGPPSICLVSDQSRYLFNCSEGTQRVSFSAGIRFSKLRHVFSTRMSCDTLGGLPGLLLTLGDAGVSQLTVHAPPGIKYYLDHVAKFTRSKPIEIRPNEIDSNHQFHFDEDNLIVQALLHYADQTSFSPPSSPPPPQPPQRQLATTAAPRSPRSISAFDSPLKSNPHVRSRQFPTIPTPCASFICHLPEVPGKFDIAKAKALKLVPGPAFAKLKNGETVTVCNSDGDLVTVTPEQVIGLPTPSPKFGIIHCPSVAFVNSITSHPAFAQFQLAESKQPPPQSFTYLFHLTPLSVLTEQRYLAWMHSFGTDCVHVLADGNCCIPRVSLPGSKAFASSLGLLSNDFFPQIDTLSSFEMAEFPFRAINGSEALHSKNAYLWPGQWSQLIDVLPECTIPSEHLLHFQLLPASKAAITRVDYSGNSLSPRRSVAKKLKQFASAADSKAASRKPIAQSTAALTFLGTGSAIPSKYRNVASMYLQLDDESAILLDCGEASLNQLSRIQDSEGLSAAIKRLKLIWISHMHADHHLGLISVLSEFSRLTSDSGRRLTVIAPEELLQWLDACGKCFADDVSFDFISNSRLAAHSPLISKHFSIRAVARPHSTQPFNFADSKLQLLPEIAKLQQELGLEEFFCVPVNHCFDSYGLVLRHKDWKLVYSGDTRPHSLLALAGHGTDVLIHEASFSEDEQEIAVMKKHSTLGEAIDVAKEMQADHLLATHFSQRYPRFSSVAASHSISSLKVIPAFDLMRVPLNSLDRLATLVPAFDWLMESTQSAEEAQPPEENPQKKHKKE